MAVNKLYPWGRGAAPVCVDDDLHKQVIRLCRSWELRAPRVKWTADWTARIVLITEGCAETTDPTHAVSVLRGGVRKHIRAILR